MTEPATRRGNIRERIRAIAFDLLEQNAPGLRFSELQRQIQLVDPKLKPGTINTSIWNLAGRAQFCAAHATQTV